MKLGKHEHLTKERELELGVLIQNRAAALPLLEKARKGSKRHGELTATVATGEAAIEELVKANLGLVYDRARIFKSKFPGAPDLEDLIQEGMTGLMTAVHKYDPARGNKFSTVAYYWIAQSIGRGVNKTGRLVRLPENRIADYSKMTAVISKYEEENLSGSQLDQKIKDEVGLSQTEITNIRNAANWHTSLNKRIGSAGDSGSRELMDVIGESNAVTGPEYSVATSECFRILTDSIAHLGPVQQEVVASHFSLELNGQYLVAQEVREKHDLSTSRYRRLLTEGLDELKASLAARDLQLADFLEA